MVLLHASVIIISDVMIQCTAHLMLVEDEHNIHVHGYSTLLLFFFSPFAVTVFDDYTVVVWYNMLIVMIHQTYETKILNGGYHRIHYG